MSLREHTAEALRRVALFAGLSDRTLERVARVAIQSQYAPGETIILEGAPCRAAYFIAAGQGRVYRPSIEGRQQVLVQLGPGRSFNTVPPFEREGVNHASVEAIGPVTLFSIRVQDLRRLIGDCPELAMALLEDFATRLDHLTDLVEDLSLHTVRGRLARFLLDHADADAVARRWTQAEIADRLGTVRDMIGRTLRAFADAGLVRIERHRIVLLDRKGLEAEAQR